MTYRVDTGHAWNDQVKIKGAKIKFLKVRGNLGNFSSSHEKLKIITPLI